MDIDFLLKKRIAARLTQEAVAKQLGMGKASYQKIEAGINNLAEVHWDKIKTILSVSDNEIKEFAAIVALNRFYKRQKQKQKQLEDTIDISPPEEIKKQFQNAKNSEVKLITEIPRNKLFPVLGEAAAASVDTLSFPLADYAQDHAEELQYFPHGQPGDFSIQVAGTSMLPWYPPGTRLLLRGNVRIKNGERVVVIMEDGEVIFKIFVKADDKIALFSIEDNGRDYVFDAHNAREIKGIYKVIESFRDEAKLDEAMQQAGIHHRWEDKLAKLKEKGR